MRVAEYSESAGSRWEPLVLSTGFAIRGGRADAGLVLCFCGGSIDRLEQVGVYEWEYDHADALDAHDDMFVFLNSLDEAFVAFI